MNIEDTKFVSLIRDGTQDARTGGGAGVVCHGGNEVWVCLGGVHALPLHLSRRDHVVGKFNLDSIRHGLLFKEAALTRPTSRPPPKTRPDTCEMATLMQSILFSNSPAVCVPGDAVVDRQLPGDKGGRSRSSLAERIGSGSRRRRRRSSRRWRRG